MKRITVPGAGLTESNPLAIFYMISPDGNIWAISIDNTGAFVITTSVDGLYFPTDYFAEYFSTGYYQHA